MAFHGLVGIDGGGSHTEAVLCTTDGRIINRTEAGPASGSGTPLEQSEHYLRKLLDELLMNTRGDCILDCVFAGISGCGVERDRLIFTQMIQNILQNKVSVYVDSDTLNPVYAAGKKDQVISAICGTGSVAVAVTETQRIRVDGHGYMLGDDAGGFCIGRNVLHAILRHEDGRGPSTQMAEMFYKQNGRTVVEMDSELTDGGKKAIASYAPLAFQAMETGDEVAAEILTRAADSMAEIIDTAARWISISPIPVILGGSLWSAGHSYIFHRVQQQLGGKFEWITSTVSPVYGAVRKAAELCGISNFKLYGE